MTTRIRMRTSVPAGLALGGVLALTALTACTSSDASASDASASDASSTPRASATPSTSGPAPLALGTAYTTKDGSATLTVTRVLSVAYPVQPSHLGPVQVGGALVKGCVLAGDGRFTWDAWTATDGAGFVNFHLGPTADQPKAKFPSVASEPLAVGTCSTGWVYFDVGASARIAEVTWADGTDTASWSAS